MSHFVVLVIGDDYEQQLAPYDENTQVAPYRDYKDADDVAWYRRIYREQHDGADAPSDQALVDFMSEHWEENIRVDEKGIYTLSTYNPNSKWDWYSVGGRWAGYYKVKPGTNGALKGAPGLMGAEEGNDADVCRKGDVDVEAMRDDWGQKAGSRYDLVAQLLEGLELAKPWGHFYEKTKKLVDALPEDESRDEEARSLWDSCRQEYGDQPAVKALRAYAAENRGEDNILGWDPSPEDYQGKTREEYVEYWRSKAICPFAYVVDGEWFAPGRMGWFGARSESDAEREQFTQAFNEMFEALPDDTLLTIVDCHI